MKQGIRAETFIFASLLDICHLKNAELEAKHQKYEGRVVLRGDIVKDDFGSYKCFLEVSRRKRRAICKAGVQCHRRAVALA